MCKFGQILIYCIDFSTFQMLTHDFKIYSLYVPLYIYNDIRYIPLSGRFCCAQRLMIWCNGYPRADRTSKQYRWVTNLDTNTDTHWCMYTHINHWATHYELVYHRVEYANQHFYLLCQVEANITTGTCLQFANWQQHLHNKHNAWLKSRDFIWETATLLQVEAGHSI